MAGRCKASEHAQDAWDAGDASLESGHNADGSDAGSVVADEVGGVWLTPTFLCFSTNPGGFPEIVKNGL